MVHVPGSLILMKKRKTSDPNTEDVCSLERQKKIIVKIEGQNE